MTKTMPRSELSKPANDLLKTWWALESEVREIARDQDPVIAEVADLGFALITEGHDVVGQGKWALWEGIFALAIAQLENTSASTWELAYAGYYVQARALTRLMTEYLAVIWYLPSHPEEAMKWNQLAKEPPSAGEILQKVFASDEESGRNFLGLRKYLHRFAHQDSVGMLAVYEQGAEPTDLGVNLRARFDQSEFQAVARDLLVLHGSVVAAMSSWRGDRNADWKNRVAEYVDRVARLVDAYDERERKKLQSAGT